MVTPTESQLIDYFERSVHVAEMPISTFHCAGKIILSEHVHKKGFKVVLTGEGADEVFAGYAYFLVDYLRSIDNASRLLGIPLPTEEELTLLLKEREARGFPQDHISLGKFSFDDAVFGRDLLGGIWFHRFWAAQCVTVDIFTADVLMRHGPQDHTIIIAEGFLADSRLKMVNRVWHPLDSALYTDCHSHLPNWGLNILGDRAEMANSIEGRPPFLDHCLSEYAQQLPPSMKLFPRCIVQDGRTSWEFTEKFVVREAVKPFVTEEVFNRRKVQYNSPIAHHVTENGSTKYFSSLQKYLKGRVSQEAVEKLGWANWIYIGELLSDYLQSPATPADGGLDKRARLLLIVVSFIILQEQFNIPTFTL
ncbi:hypothetical protein AN958_01339 [Leucoagaricus sp. SymC.cos]|nr:hypothetical protein AN958_01339 [Leucoagaricus sp. SymC.cos]